MPDEMTIRIETERNSREVVGGDTMILNLPEVFLAKIDDGPAALLMVPLTKFLRELSEKSAANVGDLLHHADWIITSDRETVTRLGIMHEHCADCEAGVLVAVAALEDNPAMQLLVGQLFWSAAEQ